MESLQDFVIAINLESWEAFEDALAGFEHLKEVRGNGTVEIGFLSKTIKPLGMGIGKALAAAPPKLAQRWLKRMAENEKAAVRCMACLVYGEIAKVDPEPEVLINIAYKLARDERWEVRECIANAFDDQVGLAHPDFVYDLMSKWVTDSNPNVRRVPTNALMRYGIRNPKNVIVLMNHLRHDDSEYVRKNVKFCLQQIAKEKHPILGKGNPDNPDLMLATLNDWAADPEKYNRWIVASTLGNVWAKNRMPQAMALLKSLASDEDKSVRSAVITAMRELGKQDSEAVRAEATQWAADTNAHLRAAGEKILTKVD